MEMTATESNLDQIWGQALAVYAKTTDRDPKKSKGLFSKFRSSKELLTELDSPKTPKDLEEFIQDRQGKFSNWRNPKAHPKLWTNLYTCLKPLSKFGDIIKAGLGLTPFAPASVIFGAIVYLIDSAQGVSDAFDYIALLFSQLAEFTTRMDYYLRWEVDATLQKKLVEIMATLLEIFARAEDAIRKGRFREYFNVAYKGKDDKIEEAKSRLTALFEDERGLVLAKNYAATQEAKDIASRTHARALNIEGITERTEAHTTVLMSAMSNSRDMTKDMEDLALLKETLGASALDKVRRAQREFVDQLDMIDRHEKSVAQWFQDLNIFKDWIEKKAPILWILGPSGTGKSCLASRIIEYLRSRFPQDPEHPMQISVAYFYASSEDQEMRSLDIILKSIAYQISRNDPVYKSYAINLCRDADNLISTKEIWTKLFVNYFADDKYAESSAFVVVDGFDRASKSELTKFLDILASVELPDSARIRLQFALLGQDTIRGDNWSLNRRPPIEIVKANTADLMRHVKASVRKIRILRPGRLPEKERLEFQAEIVQKLTAGANGRFTWVDLVIKKVLDKGYKDVVKAAVDNASHDFLELIWQAFKNLANSADGDGEFNELNDFNLILTWVTFAQRPLSLGEINTIVRLDKPNHEENTLLEEDIRGKFATFFTLHRQDRLTTQILTAQAWERYRANVRMSDAPVNVSDDGYDDGDEDFGPDLNFQSDLKTTTLQFSDEKFREYMALETDLAKRNFPVIPELELEMNQSHYKILMSSLAALCDTQHGTTYTAPNLLNYSADHWGAHFMALETTKLNVPDQKAMATSFVKLYSERASLITWTGSNTNDGMFLKNYICNSQLTKKLCEFLASQASTAEPGESLPIRSLSASGTALLQPFADYCFSQWLSPAVKDSPVKFWVFLLYLYSSFSKEGHPTDNAIPGTDTIDLKQITLDQLQLLAEKSNMEKSATWHRRLGVALRVAGYIKEAIVELQRSFKLDDGESYTYFGLAFCSESRREFSEAINWMRQGLDRLEEGSDFLKSAQLVTLSKWNLEVLEVDVAIKCAEEARILDPQNVLPAFTQLRAFNALELPLRAPRIFEYLDLLRTLPTEHAGLSMLTRIFSYGMSTQMIVIGVANTAEQYRLLLEAYYAAEAECEAIGDHLAAANHRYVRGELLNEQMGKPEEAITVFEELLAREVNTQYESSSIEDEWNSIRSSCSFDLSIIYFNLAVAARESGKDVTIFIAKLENLAKKSYGSFDVLGTGNASVALASLYRLEGRDEDADESLRKRILQSIAILEDSDPDNDFLGYFGLAQTLLMAGRRDDAMAAAAPMTISLGRSKARYEERKARAASVASPPLPDDAIKDASAESRSLSLDQAKSHEQEQVETDEMMAWMMDLWETSAGACNGCKRTAVEVEEVYCCEYCMDNSLCDVCYPKMIAGALKLDNCSSKHSYMKIYPVPEEAKEVATHVVNGKLLPRKEWLDKLRSDWAA